MPRCFAGSAPRVGGRGRCSCRGRRAHARVFARSGCPGAGGGPGVGEQTNWGVKPGGSGPSWCTGCQEWQKPYPGGAGSGPGGPTAWSRSPTRRRCGLMTRCVSGPRLSRDTAASPPAEKSQGNRPRLARGGMSSPRVSPRGGSGGLDRLSAWARGHRWQSAHGGGGWGRLASQLTPNHSSSRTSEWDRAQGSTQALSGDTSYTYVPLPCFPLRSEWCAQSEGRARRIL